MDGTCLKTWRCSLRGGVRHQLRVRAPPDLQQWQHDDAAGGLRSRHGDSDEVMNAAAARAEWLRQEMMMLQLQMEREARQSGGRLSASYWKSGFIPMSRYRENNDDGDG